MLAALPEAELRTLGRSLEYTRLPLGRILHEPGEPLKNLFFPTSGIVSLLDVRESGASAELMVVGCEGLIGLAALLGGETATTRAVVQAEGSAYRLGTLTAKEAFAASRRFQGLVLRFTYSLILELSQTAFCNLHHVVEQQLCRWLLVCQDRLEQDEIQMTHELIASMLGVRRQGVTEAARKLQQRKAISYSRGRIKVLDRTALEKAACECYRVVKRQTATLFTDAPRETQRG